MRNAAYLLPLLLATACGRVAEGTKDALNKGGEIAGTAATEVIEGVTTGVENTWNLEVRLSEELKAKGLVLGKVQVEEDSAGFDNQLIIYLSSERSINDTLYAVAFAEVGREMGRASLVLSLAAHGADFHTVRFQARTDLERKGRVELR